MVDTVKALMKFLVKRDTQDFRANGKSENKTSVKKENLSWLTVLQLYKVGRR